MSLYREFVLNNAGVWHHVVAFIKAHAQDAIEKGHPLRLIITAEDKRRTPEANRFYFGVVLREVADQAWVDGKQFSSDTWHEYFADLFGIKVEKALPDGRLILVRKSTSEYTAGEFSDYLAKVQANAANDFGVTFESFHG